MRAWGLQACAQQCLWEAMAVSGGGGGVWVWQALTIDAAASIGGWRCCALHVVGADSPKGPVLRLGLGVEHKGGSGGKGCKQAEEEAVGDLLSHLVDDRDNDMDLVGVDLTGGANGVQAWLQARHSLQEATKRDSGRRKVLVESGEANTKRRRLVTVRLPHNKYLQFVVPAALQQ